MTLTKGIFSKPYSVIVSFTSNFSELLINAQLDAFRWANTMNTAELKNPTQNSIPIKLTTIFTSHVLSGWDCQRTRRSDLVGRPRTSIVCLFTSFQLPWPISHALPHILTMCPGIGSLPTSGSSKISVACEVIPLAGTSLSVTLFKEGNGSTSNGP
jgi:hypothetical protein